jgi:alpha-tubulin suppressor-like RCC1 family protein
VRGDGGHKLCEQRDKQWGNPQANKAQTITAGFRQTLAIKTDLSLWAWGRNDFGQLGDGTNADKNAPVQVGGARDWAAVSAGYFYTLALKTDLSLWAWGRNDDGQLGDGTNANKITPVQVGSSRDWVAPSAGGSEYSSHTLALKADGSLWAWGWNREGQLGDGTNIDKNTPVQIGTGYKVP